MRTLFADYVNENEENDDYFIKTATTTIVNVHKKKLILRVTWYLYRKLISWSKNEERV
jgi:hypothetical protein